MTSYGMSMYAFCGRFKCGVMFKRCCSTGARASVDTTLLWKSINVRTCCPNWIVSGKASMCVHTVEVPRVLSKLDLVAKGRNLESVPCVNGSISC